MIPVAAAGRGRAAIAALALAAGLIGFAAVPGRAQTGQAPGGPVVRLVYRTLQPGEALLVFLDPDRSVRWAKVSFLERTAELRQAPGGRGLFAFLGIDVQTKPGSYPLTVKVLRSGGELETVRKGLTVAERKFPSTKLQFKPEYVTPPASLQARIKREAELVALALSVVTPEWLGDGPFAAPNEAPSWANFGQQRLNNNVLQSLHTGLDLRVPFGEPIKASNAGRVVLASDLYLGGKTVIIDHGLGVFSTYGHMSELRVRRGDPVKKGQTIGLCGTTGRSTGPHLHWSFRILDARIDPDSMLRLPI